MMPTAVWTLGHSKHPLDQFLDLLRQHEAEVLVDVRSHPVSRFSPQFSRKPLEAAVSGAAIRYMFLGDALGGRPQDPACYDEAGHVDYERIERQDFYQRGIARLRDGIGRFRVCLLCAEENPAHCHRRLLITRTLVRDGVEVHHIRGTGAIETEPQLQEPEQLSLFVKPPAA
jgi:uncharacterized protein (DUF488 family)